MKNFFKKMARKANETIEKVKSTFKAKAMSARAALASESGEGYIDTGVKIIIGVVVGGVILAGLYALFNTTIIPTLGTKIAAMFAYTGK